MFAWFLSDPNGGIGSKADISAAMLEPAIVLRTIACKGDAVLTRALLAPACLLPEYRGPNAKDRMGPRGGKAMR